MVEAPVNREGRLIRVDEVDKKIVRPRCNPSVEGEPLYLPIGCLGLDLLDWAVWDIPTLSHGSEKSGMMCN